MFQTKRGAIVLALMLAIAAFGGYGVFKGVQKRAQQRAITALVQDTTVRLRQALVVAPDASAKNALPRLKAHAAAVEAHLGAVRKAGSAPNPALAEGAEYYVQGAREILRRQVTSVQLSGEASASRQALVAHMGRAARRDESWIREAMNQKKRVETAYFNYNTTLKALSEVLWTFPDARKRLAPHLDAALLLEVGPVEDARRRVLEESRRTGEELDRIRRLAPGR